MSYGPKPKILVVEDEHAMQILLRDDLEGDYEITPIENGRQANKRIKTTVFKAAPVDRVTRACLKKIMNERQA